MQILDSIARKFPASLLFNNVPVPKNLSDITRSAEETEDLAPLGMVEKDRASIWQAVERFHRSGAHPATIICLRRRGKVVLNRAIGHSHGELNQPDALVARPDTPVCLFSASKAVAAMLVHKLAELGQIELHRPLAYYIPEFGQRGKDTITVEDILRHRSGVPHLRLDSIVSLVDHDCVMQCLYRKKPHPFVKNQQAYHAVSGGHLIAELVKRVTGEPFTAIHDRYIRQPLGMKYFTYGLSPDYEPIVAHNAVRGMKVLFPMTLWLKNALGFSLGDIVAASNLQEFRDAVVPAGNMYATAEECSRFYQMLLDGGVYKGKSVFKPETIHYALQGPLKPIFDRTMLLPVRFSRGLMLGGLPLNLWGADARQAYGHLGLLNILTWACPERELSGAILTTGKQFLGPHLVNLYRLTGTINRHCSKQTARQASAIADFA